MKIRDVVCGMSIALSLPALVLAQPATPKKVVKTYVPPKTVWGDPNIAGVYTNNDESLIPF